MLQFCLSTTQLSEASTGDEEISSPFIFEIFNVAYLDGLNITRTPLRERKVPLQELLTSDKLKGTRGQLRYSDHVEGNGPAEVEFTEPTADGSIRHPALSESRRREGYRSCSRRVEFSASLVSTKD